MMDGSNLQNERMPFMGENPSSAIDDWMKIGSQFLGVSLDDKNSAKAPNLLTTRLHEFQKLVSQVSMHLGEQFSVELNEKLVSLLDEEQWEEEDVLPSVDSFKTFCRMLVILGVEKKPGLGVSIDGSSVAAWTNGKNRLTIECKRADVVHWVLSREITENQSEKAAGILTVSRLIAILAPYSPNIWLQNA